MTAPTSPLLVEQPGFGAHGAVTATVLSVGEADGQCCPHTPVAETLQRRGSLLAVTHQSHR